MCCLRENILTLRLSVGGRTDARTDGRTHARTDGRTENIYSIFRDKLLLLGEHGHESIWLFFHFGKIATYKIDRNCDVLPIVKYNLLKRTTGRL